jgi:hypothetical protein
MMVVVYYHHHRRRRTNNPKKKKQNNKKMTTNKKKTGSSSLETTKKKMKRERVSSIVLGAMSLLFLIVIIVLIVLDVRPEASEACVAKRYRIKEGAKLIIVIGGDNNIHVDVAMATLARTYCTDTHVEFVRVADSNAAAVATTTDVFDRTVTLADLFNKDNNNNNNNMYLVLGTSCVPVRSFCRKTFFTQQKRLRVCGGRYDVINSTLNSKNDYYPLTLLNQQDVDMTNVDTVYASLDMRPDTVVCPHMINQLLMTPTMVSGKQNDADDDDFVMTVNKRARRSLITIMNKQHMGCNDVFVHFNYINEPTEEIDLLAPHNVVIGKVIVAMAAEVAAKKT